MKERAQKLLDTSLNRREFLGFAATGAVAMALGKHTPEVAEQSYYDRFVEAVKSEKPRSPELVPENTWGDHFGLNVLQGEYPDLIVADAKALNAKSLLYNGTRPDFLRTVTDTQYGIPVTIITRYHESADNIFKRDALLDTIRSVKEYVHRPIIEVMNEGNLYNSRKYVQHGHAEASPAQLADRFMDMAKIVQDLGCVPLLPPTAPHTPYSPDDFPYGDELEWFSQFLERVAEHADCNRIKRDMQVSLHSYQRHSGEDPIPRLRKIDRMIQDKLGQRFPVHFTEFGLTAPLLGQDEVARALEVRKILSSPIPNDFFEIASVNWWTMYAQAPEQPTTDSQNTLVENYVDQSLRKSQTEVSLMYRAVQYTQNERKEELDKKSLREMQRARFIE